MTALERLGLEVAAYTMLGSRMTAAILLALLDGRGGLVSYETLATAKQWRMAPTEPAPRRSIQVKITHLRHALEDLGIEAPIRTVDSDGYALPEPGRSNVISRLVEVAA